MYLDCCEKAYSLAITDEDTWENFEKKIHPLEAYFSFDELK